MHRVVRNFIVLVLKILSVKQNIYYDIYYISIDVITNINYQNLTIFKNHCLQFELKIL